MTNYKKSVAGIIGLRINLIMGFLFLIEGITRISFAPFFFYPDTPLIMFCGILAVLGVILGLKGYRFGKFLCLIAGISAIVGFLIFYMNFPFRFVLIAFAIVLPVVYFLAFINLAAPFVFLFGGILSVIPKKELTISDKYNPNSVQRKTILCPDCGKEVPPTRFCVNCGNQFKD
jgi:hypothetical protein